MLEDISDRLSRKTEELDKNRITLSNTLAFSMQMFGLSTCFY